MRRTSPTTWGGVSLLTLNAMMTYDFNKQKQWGETQAAHIDTYFGKFFTIEPASDELDRLGIDRIFARCDTGVRFGVEYKADEKAAITGNVFIETVAVDERDVYGWAYTSLAQKLVYYVPALSRCYVHNMIFIKSEVAGWARQYPVNAVKHGRLEPASYPRSRGTR